MSPLPPEISADDTASYRLRLFEMETQIKWFLALFPVALLNGYQWLKGYVKITEKANFENVQASNSYQVQSFGAGFLSPSEVENTHKKTKHKQTLFLEQLQLILSHGIETESVQALSSSCRIMKRQERP